MAPPWQSLREKYHPIAAAIAGLRTARAPLRAASVIALVVVSVMVLAWVSGPVLGMLLQRSRQVGAGMPRQPLRRAAFNGHDKDVGITVILAGKGDPLAIG